jgi:hypothetical protein
LVRVAADATQSGPNQEAAAAGVLVEAEEVLAEDESDFAGAESLFVAESDFADVSDLVSVVVFSDLSDFSVLSDFSAARDAPLLVRLSVL